MSDPAALERSYRRLLAWYPRGFRREYEQEVLAVLLAGARPGPRRPGLAEAGHLILSGLGARPRRPWGIAGGLACAVAVGALGDTPMTPQSYARTAAGRRAAPTATSRTQQTRAGAVVQMAPVTVAPEAQLVTSATVTMLAAHLMHSSLLPPQLSSGVTVAVPPNSAVLNITCHAPTAAAAATCAKAFAKAYVQTKNRDASWEAHRIGTVIITPP